MKAVQDEYATKYLEHMNIEPNGPNKNKLLEQQPLTACLIVPSWNSSGWLADQLQIFPNPAAGKKNNAAYIASNGQSTLKNFEQARE